MSFELKNIKRPSTALVKLVEAIGILLGIPRSANSKSKYKAPTPTNYDDTIDYLSLKFYSAMNFLVNQRDADISNEVASELYSKILEPGFNYEEAVKDGGLMSRDLFNLVYLILIKLQADSHRIPIQVINIMVVVDGSRSSYVALDFATHMFSHGICTIGALSIGEFDSSIMREHLYADISRRCKLQYKLSEHNFRVEAIVAESEDDVTFAVRQSLVSTDTNILVFGMSDCNIGLDSTNKLLLWAAWSNKLPVLFTKGCSRSRLFSSVVTSRVFQICIKNIANLKDLFLQSLSFLRPGDSVVVVSLVKSRAALADCRQTRHDMGMRSGWVTGPVPALPDFTPEYSEEYAETLRREMCLCIEKAQVRGRVRIQARQPMRTVAQELCQIAFEEESDVVVLRNSRQREVITECARDAPCSIAIIK